MSLILLFIYPHKGMFIGNEGYIMKYTRVIQFVIKVDMFQQFHIN